MARNYDMVSDLNQTERQCSCGVMPSNRFAKKVPWLTGPAASLKKMEIFISWERNIILNKDNFLVCDLGWLLVAAVVNKREK